MVDATSRLKSIGIGYGRKSADVKAQIPIRTISHPYDSEAI